MCRCEEKMLCIGKGPECRPFRDLRSVPEAGRPEGPVFRSFSYVKQSWDFSLFRNSDRLAGTFRRSEIPV